MPDPENATKCPKCGHTAGLGADEGSELRVLKREGRTWTRCGACSHEWTQAIAGPLGTGRTLRGPLLDQLTERLDRAGVEYQRTETSVKVGALSATLKIDPDGHSSFEVRDRGNTMGFRSLQQAAAMLGAPRTE